MQPDSPNNQQPQPPVAPEPQAPVTPPTPPAQPPVGYTPASQPQMPPQQPAKKSGNKLPLLLIIGLVVVGAVAAAVYFLMPKQNSANNSNSNQSSNAFVPAIDLTTLKSAKLNGPDMSGYTLALDSPTSKQYAKGNCNIVFGITNAVELPGSTYDDIMAKKVASYPAQGITATPSAGTALVLKDATDSSKQYSLRTTVLTATSGATHVLAYYSIAILGDGSRAFVTRACNSTTGDVSESAMTEIEAKAHAVTVTPQ